MEYAELSMAQGVLPVSNTPDSSVLGAAALTPNLDFTLNLLTLDDSFDNNAVLANASGESSKGSCRLQTAIS